MVKKLTLAALLLGLVVGQARAGVVGTQGFGDSGSPSVNTGDINTATVFTIGDLVTTSASTGAFVGLPTQTFGPVTFDTTVATSFTFGDAAFGTFASTSISLATSVSGVVGYFILGSYTPGTFVGGGAATPASFTISFTQTPAHTGSISDSGTFSVPPSTPPGVPEPSSMLLGVIGIGIVSACRFARRRRKTARSA